ncbi:hypothetical protein HLA97_17305 [Gordonia araii NBRC 100433]|nr:hypothetical protein [Gordonia araii NBRC 100433]
MLLGATGYVGGLTAQEMARTAPPGTRIALAGRDQRRLDDVVQRCGSDGARFDTMLVDVEQADSVTAMAESTAVVVTTVGPYTEHGADVVRACADAGTDYADLTGEPLFVRDSIARFDEPARVSGARIVHSCGFDSVPSDLLVALLHDAAQADDEGELTDTTLVVRRIRGGISGGTAASGLAHGRTMAADPSARRAARDPYTHSHRRDDEPNLGPQSDGRLVRLPEIDPGLRGWAGGFFMAPHNARVVRRSNTLTDWSYGRRFAYSEVMAMPGGPLGAIPAAVMAAGLSSTMYRTVPLLKLVPPAVLDAFAPKRGSGPSARARAKGHFTFETYTRTTKGARYRATFAMRGDPGYAATAVILSRAAYALALDRDEGAAGGVLTPAVAMADPLTRRLRDAGVDLRVERLADDPIRPGIPATFETVQTKEKEISHG